MDNLIYGECRKRIRRFEGYRGHLYLDSKGNITGGIGHNFTAKGIPEKILKKYGANWVFKEISEERAEEIFTIDMEETFIDLVDIFGFDIFNDFHNNVQYALMDMCFNMGKSSFCSFSKMRYYLYAGMITDAAEEVRKSKYWRDCEAVKIKLTNKGVKGAYNRAEENAKLMNII